MLRHLSSVLLAALALVACSTVPNVVVAPYPPVATAPVPRADPSVFLNAPRATALYQLFACYPTVTNVGEISQDGQVMSYTPYMHTDAGDLLRNPTEAACVSSGFGTRADVMGGEIGKAHTGVDLARPSGGFIFAAGAGRVVSLGPRGSYGLAVELDHGAGVHTLYAHLSEIDPRLAVGSEIPAGAAIARMGATGNATGVHLHYEVSLGQMKVDPVSYNASPLGF